MADEIEGDGPVSDTQLLEEINTRKVEVEKFLAKKNKAQALQLSLQNPPVATKTLQVKDANTEIIEKVLNAISDSELAGLVGDLDIELCEVLMKYVYRIIEKYVPRVMENPVMEKPPNFSPLLKLHALLVDKAGLGCIVRVMTDRKTV